MSEIAFLNFEIAEEIKEEQNLLREELLDFSDKINALFDLINNSPDHKAQQEPTNIKYQRILQQTKLIKLKTEAEKYGWPLVNWLAKQNEYQVIDLFIDEVNINYIDKDFGRTPLHWAVFNAATLKDYRLLDLMLEGKNLYIDLKDVEQGRTALCMAAFLNDAKIVRKLLLKQPNVEIKDECGYNALHWAIIRNNLESVKHLIGAGANLTSKTANGITALVIAENNLELSDLFNTIYNNDQLLFDLFKPAIKDNQNKVLFAKYLFENFDNWAVKFPIDIANIIRKNMQNYLKKLNINNEQQDNLKNIVYAKYLQLLTELNTKKEKIEKTIHEKRIEVQLKNFGF